MRGILFLAHRLPFPPDRGDKIRSHHILEALARLAPVHVGCFAESAADLANESYLAGFARSYCIEARDKSLIAAGLEALWRREPVSLAAFRHAGLKRWVERRLSSREIDTVYVFSGQMAQYVPEDWPGRVIVDLVDVDSAKFEAYAAQQAWPMRAINAREGRLLAAEEARIARRARQTLLVSQAEAELLRVRTGGAGRIEALRNGIDAASYDPDRTAAHPALSAAAGPHIVFTGQMDYAPNIAAALRAIERLMPAIRRVHPTAEFHVVGRAPVAALRSHHGQGGCRVWGEVPDVRPFLAGADIVLAPLEIARGVQNKVLEAMAMARPVVLTSAAATGIDAADGQHFAIADGDAALVATTVALLADAGRAASLGMAARRIVLDRMSWPAALAQLPQIVGRGIVRECRDAA